MPSSKLLVASLRCAELGTAQPQLVFCNFLGLQNWVFFSFNLIDKILNVFSMDYQFALIPFAWCQASPSTSLYYPQVILWCHFKMTIFWPYPAILVENIGGFYQILMHKINFFVQKDFKNDVGSNGNNCSEDRKKKPQKWPKMAQISPFLEL